MVGHGSSSAQGKDLVPDPALSEELDKARSSKIKGFTDSLKSGQANLKESKLLKSVLKTKEKDRISELQKNTELEIEGFFEESHSSSYLASENLSKSVRDKKSAFFSEKINHVNAVPVDPSISAEANVTQKNILTVKGKEKEKTLHTELEPKSQNLIVKSNDTSTIPVKVSDFEPILKELIQETGNLEIIEDNIKENKDFAGRDKTLGLSMQSNIPLQSDREILYSQSDRTTKNIGPELGDSKSTIGEDEENPVLFKEPSSIASLISSAKNEVLTSFDEINTGGNVQESTIELSENPLLGVNSHLKDKSLMSEKKGQLFSLSAKSSDVSLHSHSILNSKVIIDLKSVSREAEMKEKTEFDVKKSSELDGIDNASITYSPKITNSFLDYRSEKILIDNGFEVFVDFLRKNPDASLIFVKALTKIRQKLNDEFEHRSADEVSFEEDVCERAKNFLPENPGYQDRFNNFFKSHPEGNLNIDLNLIEQKRLEAKVLRRAQRIYKTQLKQDIQFSVKEHCPSQSTAFKKEVEEIIYKKMSGLSSVPVKSWPENFKEIQDQVKHEIKLNPVIANEFKNQIDRWIEKPGLISQLQISTIKSMRDSVLNKFAQTLADEMSSIVNQALSSKEEYLASKGYSDK